MIFCSKVTEGKIPFFWCEGTTQNKNKTSTTIEVIHNKKKRAKKHKNTEKVPNK